MVFPDVTRGSRRPLDTGLFIALLNPTIALALGAAFHVLWFYQRHRPYLAVIGVS